MQSPTCTNVRIRSTHDVHRIFYAVYLGILPMITRRLDVKEREALRSGSCYAWEDRGPHAITGLGIERFTEGRHWSPSRIRDEFLFYYEKWEPPKNRTSNPQTNAASDSDEHPPRDWDPLVKQTYSVWLLSDSGRRKWHLTAYFTQATVDRLGTVDDIPGVRDLVVPDGLFRSSRINKAKRNGNAPNSDPTPPIGNGSSAQTPANSSAPPSSSSSSNQERTYSHFPPRPEAERERYGCPPPPQAQGFGYPSSMPNYTSPGGSHMQPVAGPSRIARSSSPSTVPPSAYTLSPRTDDPSYPGMHPYYPPNANYPQAYPGPSQPSYNWSYGVEPSADHIPRSSYLYPLPAGSGAEYVYPYGYPGMPLPPSSSAYYLPPAPVPAEREPPSPPSSSPAISHSSGSAPSSTGSAWSSYSRPSSRMHSASPMVLTHSHSHSPVSPGSALPHLSTPSVPAAALVPVPTTDDVGSDGEVSLAPLHALRRHHPYRRDPADDRALQILGSRRA